MTVHLENRDLRQQDILPLEILHFPIHVIGVGAIGSITVTTLSQMGCDNITIWDNDLVAEHNISNQFCKHTAEGESKVEALKSLVQELTGFELSVKQEKYKDQFDISGLVICAVDSLEARREIWEGIKERFDIACFIDARMALQSGELYCIDPGSSDDVEFYEKTISEDNTPLQLPCTARSIIYCPLMTASLIGFMTRKYALNEEMPREIYFDITTLSIKVGPLEEPDGKPD